MTFKKGDRVVSRDKSRAARTFLVEAVHEESGKFWGLQVGGHATELSPRQPLTYDIDMFKKVEPFFEAGKTYRYQGVDGVGATFEVLRVDAASSGTKWAYGKQTESNGSYYFVQKDHYAFDFWKEEGVQ